jgi:hypothetical protein
MLTPLSFALRLRSAVGHSQIADGWGEMLTARDLWEVLEHGGLEGPLLGPWTIGAGTFAVAWAIWAGWKVQAGAAGVAAKAAPMLLAVPTALCAGAVPLWLLHASLWSALACFASAGIQSLAWADFVGSPLLRMCFASSLLLQWWLCRADLAHGTPKDVLGWLGHVKVGFLRLWSHPVQWGAIVFFGVVLRSGLSFSVLALAWRWGGQSLPKVWTLYALQAAAAAANAWAIGWALRTTALYWRNDAEVRATIRELEKGAGYSECT